MQQVLFLLFFLSLSSFSVFVLTLIFGILFSFIIRYEFVIGVKKEQIVSEKIYIYILNSKSSTRMSMYIFVLFFEFSFSLSDEPWRATVWPVSLFSRMELKSKNETHTHAYMYIRGMPIKIHLNTFHFGR